MSKSVLMAIVIFITSLFVYHWADTSKPIVPIDTPLPSPTTAPPIQIPTAHTIPLKSHSFQTFNNCGPASLSMQLSYYGKNLTQQELGRQLRPYQNPKGDNDDKSVTMEELANEARKYGLIAYHRPNGTITLLKQFIAHDMPVVIRTWLAPGEDIGHYRVVRGYDDATQLLTQDDSLQGKSLAYSYSDMLELWEPFNLEYVVLVPAEKKDLAERILGSNLDETSAWNSVLTRLSAEPTGIYDYFNLSVASYHAGDYAESVQYFEEVETRLPSRMLWYQIEPIQAYFEIGNYDRVLSLTSNIIKNQNRAFSELYYLRGNTYLVLGNRGLAQAEYEKAVFYNINFQPAQEALRNL